MSEPTARRLASFAIDAPTAAIPPAVRVRAAQHLLDTIGCGLAAVGRSEGAHATAVATAHGGTPEASLLGVPQRLPAPLAAFANGVRCHALDFDDTHEAGICHSSTVVAPAALAIGEACAANGRAIVDAYVLGTEVALRIAIATADALYARGFHPTPVCGAFGAATAAARLLGLSAQQATDALGIVASFAAGLFEFLADGSATKPLHAGWAAQAGVQAARLAHAGATGPATAIEGRFGLIASHTDTPPAPLELADLGSRWETLNLSIKAFPACHFAHASTWAAAALAEEHDLAPDDIAEIVVRIPAEGEPLVLTPREAKHAPTTPHGAKFSLPFTIGYRLVHGDLPLSAFTTQGIEDETVLALARRVRFEPLTETAPSRFAGGARIVSRTEEAFDRFVPHPPGSPRNSLDEQEILAKYRANAASGLDPARVGELADLLLGLDEAPSPEPVGALLREARTPEALA